MVARMRHIALSVPDPEKAATFFEEAFGMKRAGPAGLGLYMTDGTINIALLKFPGDVPGFPPGKPYYGLIHFGMWVDNLDEAAPRSRRRAAPISWGAPMTTPTPTTRSSTRIRTVSYSTSPTAAGRAR